MNKQAPNSNDKPSIAKRIQRYSLPMGGLGMDLDHSNELAFVACIDGVYQLNLGSGKFDRLYTHDSYASNCVFVPDNNQIVSSGYDGVLKWFDLQNRTVVHQVQAHSFWSWDMAKAKNAPIIASVSGQYLAGSYDYRPMPAEEATVKVYDALSGLQLHEFEHLPPVQAVAVSDDGSLVGAGNLMGDVGVWNLDNQQRANWNTPDFTGFGIIKSHCQIGGIYAAAFASNDELIVAGMGPMRDPMAGNGKQRWQCFDLANVDADTPKPKTQSKDAQMGEGLMETLAFHPDGHHFAMAGRLRGGSWNVGLFDLRTSDLIHSFKTETRVTKAVFSHEGKRLYLAAADKQHKDAEKQFGVVDVYDLNLSSG